MFSLKFVARKQRQQMELNFITRKKHQVDQIDGNSLIAYIQEDISEEKITQAVKLIDDKIVQTETNIDLVLEGEVCEDCEEDLIGETL